jgi:hypothetical protein
MTLKARELTIRGEEQGGDAVEQLDGARGEDGR